MSGPTARRVRGWRKIAGAAWGAPDDPQFYGDLELDAGTLLEYQTGLRDEGVHVTMTHLVGKAVAHALAANPALSVRLAHGREYPRRAVEVFFIVSDPDSDELTGVKISDADRKPVSEIAAELERSTRAVRSGEDATFARTKHLLEMLPGPLARVAIRAGAWLTSDLDLDLPRLGLRRESFGGAMISSVGMWGVSRAYSPLASYYRVPVLVLVGAVRDQPVARDGEVVIRPMLTLTATFDHRYVDGSQAARFAAAAQEYCADPASFETRVTRS